MECILAIPEAPGYILSYARQGGRRSGGSGQPGSCAIGMNCNMYGTRPCGTQLRGG